MEESFDKPPAKPQQQLSMSASNSGLASIAATSGQTTQRPATITTSTTYQQQAQQYSGQTSPSSHSNSSSNPTVSGGLAPLTTSTSTTLEQFVQNFNSNSEDGERILEVSPTTRYAKLNIILGKGAYKVVYKALDRDEGYEVAWNCFQTSRAEFNELSQEVEILKRVRHPNIINFHDCWYNNVEFVFITELMTSGTLREYIRKLQIPNMKIVKRWSRQIVKGLVYLHSHDPPILHRDIKCDNIFINGAHGEVKIGDMGTAKMKLGKKYTVIGTPEFMAPEMYEEKGYNEKVDVYAFGMCLLEMSTGEYPYSECTNAAQIYKKVIQGIKPECISKVGDAEVIDLVSKCICTEAERLTAAQVLEHPFLTVEPEVVLLATNEDKSHLTLQVFFKGMEKLSVKFEFNTESDTAEDVVAEMIQENVLPQKYQSLITHDINRILRELNKIDNSSMSNKPKKEDMQWRRPADVIKVELEKAKQDAFVANERATEAEKKAAQSEVRARIAEEKSTKTLNAQLSTTSNMSVDTMISAPETAKVFPLDEHAPYIFKDEQPIEDLVKETVAVNNRGPDKVTEWLQRLHAQDIMSVGDLRDLHDEDWANLGLTVFASRALRNALRGKSKSPKTALTLATIASELDLDAARTPHTDEHASTHMNLDS